MLPLMPLNHDVHKPLLILYACHLRKTLPLAKTRKCGSQMLSFPPLFYYFGKKGIYGNHNILAALYPSYSKVLGFPALNLHGSLLPLLHLLAAKTASYISHRKLLFLLLSSPLYLSILFLTYTLLDFLQKN